MFSQVARIKFYSLVNWSIQVNMVKALNETEHFTILYYYETFPSKPLKISLLKKGKKPSK